jgi:TatD DNase family protein
MNSPEPDDYIDIHNHDVIWISGVFAIDNLMVHEERLPEKTSGIQYSAGIHPWFLTESNFDNLLKKVEGYSEMENVIAIGEAGFDKIKGPAVELQIKAFEEQVIISEEKGKPLFIHNVKGLDELLSVHHRMKPSEKWIVHGFQGKKEVACQLISRGMYLSLWADFVLNRESASVIRSIPANRLFLETDAFQVDIRDIYKKVSVDLNLDVNKLKTIIYQNYKNVFGK